MSTLIALSETTPALPHPVSQSPPTTTTTTTTDAPTTSPLLALPGEIRNTIYRLLLVPTNLPALRRRVLLNHFSGSLLPSTSTSNSALSPALLLTCRQINLEATPILYEENTFTAHPSLLTSMPYLINPARPIYCKGVAQRIRRWCITVRLDIDARFTEEDVTKAFLGAEVLEVEAKEAMYRSAGNGVLLLFKGVRGVKEVRVSGSVENEFREWLEGEMRRPAGEEGSVVPEGWRERRVWVQVNGVRAAANVGTAL